MFKRLFKECLNCLNCLNKTGLGLIALLLFHSFMSKKAEGTQKSEPKKNPLVGKTDDLKEIDPQDAEITELRATLQRVQAEFENYQKRIDREMIDYRIVANAGMMSDLLPVLDTLEQGLIHNPEFADYFIQHLNSY